ncbi:molybdenum cofactor-binding domain-containing protein [Choiromyces venosus 120613-1]|uniref:Molybdenum cofactor-binding domain-containing protein n=1 Tax=Choiromyces venosus 120613-1 TaxID=1336337 RepID=A0A3N4J6N4_9PEZI|nr:molybdenum cofactor-binding domain-containing protein [Choiromyces venosus 120613-1]
MRGIVMSLYALLQNSYDPVMRRYMLSEEMEELEELRPEDLDGVVFEGKKSKVEGKLGGNYISGAKGSGTGSCGRPGGCCKDTPAGTAKSSADESLSDGTEISSETSITETEEVPLSGAMYGALLKTCERDDYYQLSSGVNKATTEVDVLGGKDSFPQFNFKSYEPHTEIIYPLGLRKYTKQPIFYGNEKKAWFRPTTIGQLAELKHAYPPAEAVAGSSEVQVEVKFKHENYGVSVYVGDIEGLKGFSIGEEKGEVVIGGNTSLTVLEMVCLGGHKTLGKRGFILEAIRKQLRYFAGRQIRNTATPAGSIVTASPVWDLNPVLIASGAVLTAQSKTRGKFPLPMDEGVLCRLSDDGITLTIPLPVEGTREVIKSYKQAKRKDDDIAIVKARFRVLDESSVMDISQAYGGLPNESRMAPKTVEAKNTKEALLGKKLFDNTVLEGAVAAMEKDSLVGFTVPGGMPTYCKTLAFSFLFRFWDGVAAELELGTQVQQVDHEVIEEIHRGISYGSRDNDNPYEQRVTGEAEYIVDMLSIEGQLFGGLVLSKKAHAKLAKVDFTPAESAAIAQAAAQLVDVQYEELPPILTISEAIAAKSFFPHGKMLIRGKPTVETFKDCDFIYESISRMDGQEYFYLETNAAAVIPRPEDGAMEVWSSTQNIMETQEFVSQVTGAPSSRIVAKAKWMGGGFGGKESRSVQLAYILAVATKKVGRPIRRMLNCDEDMMTSGQRNPFQAHWKVGVSKAGMLKVLDADIYNNAGYSQDLSGAIMDCALTHMDPCYWIPHVHLRGHVCKTNTHSNTAFRFPRSTRSLENVGRPAPLEFTITQLKAESGHDARVQQAEESNRMHKWKKRGISLIPTKFGLSFATAVHLNQAGALVHISNDGSVLLALGGTEMGQGLHTKMCQIAAQEQNCPLDAIFTSETSYNTVANTSSKKTRIS